MDETVDLSKYRDGLIPFKAGKIIFQKGDPGDVMYLITKGEVEILIHGKVVEKVAAGGVVGELALLDMGPRSATVIASTDSLLLAIDRERFENQVKKSPNFSLQVMRVMAERLRRLDQFI
jgi:CRP/FNR family transcriptional regulator, cyclic AMP receptor protein